MIHTIDLFSAELKKELRINVNSKQLKQLETLSTLGGFKRFGLSIYDEGKHLTASNESKRHINTFLVGILLPGELRENKLQLVLSAGKLKTEVVKYKGHTYIINKEQNGHSNTIKGISSSITFKTKAEAIRRAKLTIDYHESI